MQHAALPVAEYSLRRCHFCATLTGSRPAFDFSPVMVDSRRAHKIRPPSEAELS